MSISRRSFLKLAGLTTVAVAGTAMFAGCSVASYLEIQLDDKVRKELIDELVKDDPTTDRDAANTVINSYLGLINAALLFSPMVGVSSLDKEKVFSTINDSLDKYEKSYPSKAEDVANIRKQLNRFDIVTDASGKIPATGFGYAKITIVITTKSAADTQALAAALAAAV